MRSVAPPSGLVARIGGKDVVDPSRGRTEVRDPANQALLTAIGDAATDEVVRAAEIAHTAWPQWRNTPAEKRAAALRRVAAEVRGQADALVAVITAETGKLLPEAEVEIRLAARYLDWFASIVPTGDGRVGTARVTRHPVGIGCPNTPEVPFGGFDMAGWGRERAAAGLEPFLEHHSIAYGM